MPPDTVAAVATQPPEEIAADLARLRSALDETVPAKALDRNLLIATWNVRALGDLTEKWESSETDTPKRDLHSLLCIQEIVSRLDVIAVQEAKGPIGLSRPVANIVISGGTRHLPLLMVWPVGPELCHTIHRLVDV